jgi:uncharacterized membrane protein
MDPEMLMMAAVALFAALVIAANEHVRKGHRRDAARVAAAQERLAAQRAADGALSEVEPTHQQVFTPRMRA